MVAGVQPEGVILDIAETRVWPGIASIRQYQAGLPQRLVEIVFPSQMRSLRPGVGDLDGYALNQFALDGEVPALQVWRRRVHLKPAGISDARELCNGGGKGIGKRHEGRIGRRAGESLGDGEGESAGEIG